jgi:sulfur carrier protein
MITVSVNGTDHEYPEGATVADLVLDITGHAADDDQLGVAVALDAAVVPRSRWSGTGLTTGSQVEIITAMQGG